MATEEATLERNLAKTIAPAAIREDDDETLLGEDGWPDRHLTVSVAPTRLVVGRMTIIDAGQGWMKVELDTAREMEAELLPPAEARTFIDWIMEISQRYLT